MKKKKCGHRTAPRIVQYNDCGARARGNKKEIYNTIKLLALKWFFVGEKCARDFVMKNKNGFSCIHILQFCFWWIFCF